MKIACEFRVSGRVQGVFFRQGTREQAELFGLCGWVRNRPDGSVEGFAEGPEPALESLRAWLTRGPTLARVLQLEWKPAPVRNLSGFEIRP